MPTIDVKPLVLKDVILSLGSDAYQKHVSGVVFTPTSSKINWNGLTPAATFSDSITSDWTCQLNYVQDWETPDSLSRFLFENEGEAVEASFKPKAGSGPSFTATLTIVSGAIGGQVNAYATTSATLGSTKPELVPAVP